LIVEDYMRWHIIRVLLYKEVLRQLANRGGIALAALLIVAALLMTFFSRSGNQLGGLNAGVETCYVDYWQEDGWVQHLRDNVPDDLQKQIQFRHVSEAPKSGGRLVYTSRSGAIQMRIPGPDDPKKNVKIWVWYPDSDGASMLPYELWFWRETAFYFQHLTALGEKNPELSHGTLADPTERSSSLPQLEHDRNLLKGAFDVKQSVSAGLVLFALFFSCLYLLPSLMCEERERGVLLAQALSPASPLEILAAKFLFYPAVGIALAAVLAGICRPLVLLNIFFWFALAVSAIGSLGIGLTIACLARTQRTASMAALCYMLVIALFLYICQQCAIPGLPFIALEYHCPRMLNAALADAVLWQHWGHLLAAGVLGAAWCSAAIVLFRKRGWQ
jgi:hypothetical protein